MAARAAGLARPALLLALLAPLALLAGGHRPTAAEAAPGAAAGPAAPAAPQACPESILDRYEPGDEVTVVGYTASCLPTTSEAAATGTSGTPTPVIAGYLHANPCTDVDLPYCSAQNGLTEPASGTPIGPFTLTAATEPARGQRMELTFTLPAGMATGLYQLVVCQEPCAPRTPGGVASPLYVGVDPPPDGRPVRHWPLDDPAIAALPDDALVQPGVGPTLTAAEVRASWGGAEPTDPTDPADAVAGGADVAADRPAGAGEPWRPPGWALATTLLLAVVALAAGRGRGGDRKQVRPIEPLDRTGVG